MLQFPCSLKPLGGAPCCHPKYTQSTQKQKVSIPNRYITPDMAKEIMLMYGLHRIIGSRKSFK